VDVARSGQRHVATSAIVPAGEQHILDAPDSRVGILLLDPILAPPVPAPHAVRTHPDAANWIATLRQTPSPLVDLPAWIRQTSDPSGQIDTRVIAAADLLDATVAENQRIAALAGEIGLSESRLQHLFVSETGLRLRQYRVWMRLLHAAHDAGLGRSITRAAYDNGFSSPSHFSHTFRTTFGLAPREILTARQ